MGSSTDELAVDLRHVAKTYGRKVHALRGIEMQVRRGEVFGLLGPNGAGKTTLVKIMLTVIRPTRAEGTILGQPVGHKPTLAKVGFLPENPRFPLYLKGRQALEFYGAMAKVDRPTRKRRAMELLDLVGLKDWAEAKVGTYSKGMQQRLGLAQSLVGAPELVVLDEPTDGLDPVGRRETREALIRLRDQGTTVFLNSHLLGEAELVCERIAILLGGNVVHQGTIDDVIAQTRYYEIQLHGDDVAALQAAAGEALACEFQDCAQATAPSAPYAFAPSPARVQQGTLPSGDTVQLLGGTIRMNTSSPQHVQPVIDALRGHELVIRSVRPVHQSLEDFFIALVSDSQNHPSASGPAAKGGRP
jgi:ABC-2 type transport system ATP-binding protein